VNERQMIGAALRDLILGTPFIPVLRRNEFKVRAFFLLCPILLVMINAATLVLTAVLVLLYAYTPFFNILARFLMWALDTG